LALVLHVQLFGEIQFPLPEQTSGLEEIIPKQMFNSHSAPAYPGSQEHLSLSKQIPLPVQTFGCEEFFPKQVDFECKI
jgi:hypothetical protein